MMVGIIGSSGLVGSRIIELLHNTYTFKEYNSSTGTDITNPETLKSIADDEEIDWVVLLAAKTDVDGCEQDKIDGHEGAAWRINVDGTENVVKMCRESTKKLLYVSTDFVFDGEKVNGDSYTEDDTPNPVNWYGHTKWQGEQKVIHGGVDYVIARLAYPYRAGFEKKKDFMRAIKSKLEAGLPIAGVTDHIFTPTFIDDFVRAIDTLMKSDARGIYHTVGSEFLSPYAAALDIATTFDLSLKNISKTTREVYFQGKAKRPYNLAMNNAKIKALEVEMKSFKEGLDEVKKQLT